MTKENCFKYVYDLYIDFPFIESITIGKDKLIFIKIENGETHFFPIKKTVQMLEWLENYQSNLK